MKCKGPCLNGKFFDPQSQLCTGVITCPPNAYYLNNTCVPCPAGCVSCTYDATTATTACPTCISGFVKANGLCTKNTCTAA